MRAIVAVTVLLIASSAAAGPAADPPTAIPASRAAFIVHRQVDATVSKVDPATGVLLLRTAVGRLTLGAASAATALLRTGDRVIVDVGLLRHPDPARVPREDASPRPLLMRRFAADITAVQRTLGTVFLKTAAGMLNVDLPPEAVAGLRTGDRLQVELSVLPESDGAALPRMEEQKRRAGLGALLLNLFGSRRTESQAH
jgi:hypothetical protein